MNMVTDRGGMSSPDAVTVGAPSLMARLANPAAQAARVPGPASPARQADLLAALVDAVLLVAGAATARLVAPEAAMAIETVTSLWLGVIVALLAFWLARVMPQAPDVFGSPTGPGTLQVAAGGGLAISVVGVAWCLILRAAGGVPQDMPLLLLAWVAGALAPAALIRWQLARRYGLQRVLLFGPPEQTAHVARTISADHAGRWQVAGCLDDWATDALDQLSSLVERGNADLVLLFSSTGRPTEHAAAICEQLADQAIRICLVSPMEAATAGLCNLRGFRPLELHDTPQAGFPGAAKRAFDVAGTVLALLVFGIPMLVIALAIRLETTGPALFQQWRFGLGSRPIQVLKFRTMHATQSDPTGAQRTLRRDPRVTRVGRILRRTSLDELPQLLNVLRGEMSLVGPRPHPLHMRVGDAYYFEVVEGYLARHLVKPGLTGWAQVNGSRGEVDTREKAERRVALDRWYIRRWSLLLDVRILLRTVFGGFASPEAD
jgi:exopolysaccharide biosynthesis polyprenyl glycosylphosphotransferase